MPLSRIVPLVTAAALVPLLHVAPADAAAHAVHAVHPVRAHRHAATVTVTGRGNGHGHGLSQNGAQGAALKGLDARRILDFYYPGLKHGSAGGKVAVLITEDTGKDLVVSARPGLRVSNGDRTLKLDKKGASLWRLTPADGGRRTTVAYRTRGWHTFRTLPGDALFTAGGAPVTLHFPKGATHATVAYRGVLRSAFQNRSGSKRDTVNVVPLESYLRGVVPAEAIPSWRPAALQAQAVAARTYAAFERAQPLSDHYQICDSPQCQAYDGTMDEYPTTDQAVRTTRGQILTAKGQPAFTQFSASNGGWMAAGSEPYLVAKKDPYDTVDRGWHVSIRTSAIERVLPSIGRFRSIKVTKRDHEGPYGGRVVLITVTGTKAVVALSGDTFRSYFNLMSTLFKVG